MDCNYFLFWILTFYAHTTYHFKLALNAMIGAVLGYIIASGTIGDFDSLRRSYIALSIIIIIGLCFDRYIRSVSKYFDFGNTITEPINVGVPMEKVIEYSAKKHIILLGSLVVIELIKMLSAIYCIVIMAVIFGKVGAFVNYCILALVIIEAWLGLFIYVIAIICICIKPNFFKYWMRWMAKWYLNNTVITEIYNDPSDRRRLYLVFKKITPSEDNSSTTPNIIGTLVRKDSSVESSEADIVQHRGVQNSPGILAELSGTHDTIIMDSTGTSKRDPDSKLVLPV